MANCGHCCNTFLMTSDEMRSDYSLMSTLSASDSRSDCEAQQNGLID